MAGAYKTPGVYIVEKSAFPNSVVEVATAVPAFVGYTEKADNKGKPLLNKAWRITSMAEFEAYFGGAPDPKFTIADAAPAGVTDEDFTVDGKKYYLVQDSAKYRLYYSMKLFFHNGGGPCYVVSVGTYADGIEAGKLTGEAAPNGVGGIAALLMEQEPTMVVIPEAVSLDKEADCISTQQAMLSHCGEKMRSRFAILDIYDGFKDRRDPAGDCVGAFRDHLGTNNLDFAAAYYPWVNTTIVSEKELNYTNFTNADKLQELLKAELAATPSGKPEKDKERSDVVDGIAASKDRDLTNKILCAISPLYNKILGGVQQKLNLLPPSAAMAGVYTAVDNSRGVWKAPANVSLNSVISPAVSITHDDQEDLNVTTQGKSINAVRTFIGEGSLVWGARTLDGNSLDWRYINVRRTMIMLEESIKLATKAYVFDPNVATTWVTIKSMIRNFLTGIWKRGGLAGASPDDAFAVFVGLGETMTPEDILEGYMRVTVLVAISRPAEFIEITFQQQMQKS